MLYEVITGIIGTVLNNNAIGLITLDGFGQVCYCNKAAADLFGSSRNNFV